MVPRPVFHPGLGEYFVALRSKHGWTQRQATAIAHRRGLQGIAKQTLWRLESGKVKNPEAEVLRAVAELYDVTYEDLVVRCVEAQYGVALFPAAPGREKPASQSRPALASFDPDEQRLLTRYRQVSARDRLVIDSLLSTMEAQAASRKRAKARSS